VAAARLVALVLKLAALITTLRTAMPRTERITHMHITHTCTTLRAPSLASACIAPHMVWAA
jgi:hypothetical protein